jgi:hypothetical protein
LQGTIILLGYRIQGSFYKIFSELSLFIFISLLYKAKDWVFLQEGYGAEVDGKMERAPYRARAHASRLVWFGLAEHGATRSGLYKITQQGINFLAGIHSVPSIIYCKDGVVVEKSNKQVTVREIKNIVLDKEYWDNYYMLQK